MDLKVQNSYVTIYRLLAEPDHFMITPFEPQKAKHQLMRFRREGNHGVPPDAVWPTFELEIVSITEVPDAHFIDFLRDQAYAKKEEEFQIRLGEYGWYIFSAEPNLEDLLKKYEKAKSIARESTLKVLSAKQTSLF